MKLRNADSCSRIGARMEESPVDGLVIEYLERMHRVGEEALEELCRRHPEAAHELRARVGLLTRVGLAWGGPDEGSDAEIAERLRRGLFFRWLAHETGGPSGDERG
ncbi:MAG: hypothetical protein HZA52_02760 [Planctomycetes bacterium]|nr:hypothetical protein [Planctomycetota bacterium]